MAKNIYCITELKLDTDELFYMKDINPIPGCEDGYTTNMYNKWGHCFQPCDNTEEAAKFIGDEGKEMASLLVVYWNKILGEIVKYDIVKVEK